MIDYYYDDLLYHCFNHFIDIFFIFSASGSGQGSIDHRIEQAMVSTMMIIYVCVAEIIM